MATDKLRIMQWNCRSAVSNKGALETFLSDNHINVAALSETWFVPNQYYNFSGFNCVRSDRADGKAGVAILINRNIPFIEFKSFFKPKGVMIVGATLSLKFNKKIHIISLYNKPKNKISKETWTKFFSSLPSPILITGDFNSHHNSLGSSTTDSKGKNLIESVEELNFIFLNDGSPTLVPNHTQINKSAIDISIASPDTSSNFNWAVTQDPLGSNHLPIIIASELCIHENCTVKNRIWNDRKANWDKFKQYLESAIHKNEINDQDYKQLTREINSACDLTIPKFKNKINHHISKNPWWSDSCEKATRIRREDYKQYKNCPSYNNFLKYKKSVAVAKKTIKTAKRQSWREYCNLLSKNNSITSIWNQIKSLKNRKPTNVYSSMSEAIEMEYLNNITPDSVSAYVPTQLWTQSNHFLLKRFNYPEMQKVIKKTSNTSPGLDHITYPIIRNLPYTFQKSLLKSFNYIWESGDYPEDWKKYAVIPIIKPGKTSNEASSYRPISLASCLLKTFERIVNNRLVWWIESNRIISTTQYGGRKGRSTIDSVSSLVTDIQTGFSTNQHTMAFFLDIKGAYDNINLSILYDKIIKLKIPPIFANRIVTLYSERHVYVRNKNKLIGPRVTSVGIPQGSILSQILYSIYVSDIMEILPEEVKILQFIDDISIYVTHKEMDLCHHKLDNAVRHILSWLTKNGLSLSLDKSVVCTFTRKRIDLTDVVHLGGRQFKQKACVRFLGLYLDKSLNWISHINSIVTKSEKYFNILKLITNIHWGSEVSVSLLFYRATIRSIFDYGSNLYGQASESSLRKLDIIHHKCLRRCLGLLNSTPIDVLLSESGELPLRYRRELLTNRYTIKVIAQNPALYLNISSLNTKVLTHKFWCKKKSPPLTTSFINTSPFSELIDKNCILPIYASDFYLQFAHLNILYANFDSNIPTIAYKQKIKSYFAKSNTEPYYIYTDGSKSHLGTGAAFYDPQNKYNSMIRLPLHCTIFTAEAIAIIEALRYINNKAPSNTVAIMTDSKSVLMALQNIAYKSTLSTILIKILHEVNILETNKIKIIFVWVKAHIGLENNEVVDYLAKRASQEGETVDIQLPYTDLYHHLRTIVLDKWQKEYAEGSKGKFYRNINPVFSQRTWYDNLAMPKEFCRVICRIRSNHGMCNSYKFKIQLSTNPHCDHCKVEETLEHIFIHCPEYTKSRKKLFNAIIKSVVQPFNYKTLLASKKLIVYAAMFDFLRDIKHTI